MRRKRRYRTAVVPALLLLLALLAGCRGGEEPQTQEEESGYEIYYLNQTETGISGTAYEPAGASTGELVEADGLYASMWRAQAQYYEQDGAFVKQPCSTDSPSCKLLSYMLTLKQ